MGNTCSSPSIKGRDSNLELYRIVCMLMIVAHHFVVNSGLNSPDGSITSHPDEPNSLFLLMWGMWGKTGINCFLLITGYYMCTSKITLRKFFKLLFQIYLYKMVIFLIFLAGGYETLSMVRVTKLLMPFWGFNSNFTSCFIGFYLLIPFLTVLVQNLKKRQHLSLVFLALLYYTLLGSIPKFDVKFNYITWFSILFLLASYMRLYPQRIFDKSRLWAWMTVSCVILAMGSVVFMQHYRMDRAFFFVSDSNRILAVAIAVSSFLWFKNMKMKQSKIINAIGGSTFGVLLIHANSDAMRTWLWKDTLDCVGHYNLSLLNLMLFSVGGVILIFLLCNVIDQARIHLIEKPVLSWMDKKVFNKNLPFQEKTNKYLYG